MAWFAVQSLAMIVVAFAAGVAVGWLLRRRRSRVESPGPSDPGAAVASPVPDGAVLTATEPPSGPAVDVEFWTPTTAPPASVPVHPEVSTEVVAAEPTPEPEQPPPLVESVDRPGSVDLEGSADLEESADDEEPALLDNLTLIDGVSDRMARALAAEGLGSFFAVANASEDALRRALRVNRIRSAPGISFWAARAAELMAEEKADAVEADPVDTDLLEADPVEIEPRPETTEPETTEPVASAPDDPAPDDPAPDDPDPDDPDPDDPTPDDPTPDDEELSPLAAAMAALEVAQSPASQVSEDRGPDSPAATGSPADTGSPAAAPTPRHGSAFRTAAHAPGVPSWTTITPTSSDDLERIIGVTPAIIETLHDAGVTNYTQLAAVRDEELRQILTDAQIELPRELPTWSVQAALLLQGDAESAATLAGGLMVGRENS